MTTTSTDEGAKPARPKGKGGGIMRVLAIGLAFVAGAGAGGFGVVMAVSQLGLGGGGHAKAEVAVVPVQYVEIDNAFTSNLVDTGRYLQVRISVSTKNGETVVAAIEQHKPALISTVLSVLGELSEIDVADRVAKDKLRARLKTAINQALAAKGVAGGIDEVFFTSLVVQ
jgi:flagellar basal body-associated protein FliL